MVNGIIISWAVPGQGGHSHINLKTNAEVIEALHKLRYFCDKWGQHVHGIQAVSTEVDSEAHNTCDDAQSCGMALFVSICSAMSDSTFLICASLT